MKKNLTLFTDIIIETQRNKRHPLVGTEYLLLNEYPDEHDEMDTKLFYLKEINDYIGKGKLKKFLSSEDIHSYKQAQVFLCVAMKPPMFSITRYQN